MSGSGEKSEPSDAAVPTCLWFGLDIGGTLAKLVYFEPAEVDGGDGSEELSRRTFDAVHRYITGNTAYGRTGVRDVRLEMPNVMLGKRRGSLHFIHFPTSEMTSILELARTKYFSQLATTICACGGGAFKFETEFQRTLNVNLRKLDELQCLINGIQYVLSVNANECYYIANPRDGEKFEKCRYDFSDPYPYMVVNVGSGVSILAVRGPGDFRCIGGTSMGGSTFLGLCCLLTGCETFEEAINLASHGDDSSVDMLVRDIYGGDYEKTGLFGDMANSFNSGVCSFGRMMSKECREATPKCDLAMACLSMITCNICSTAQLKARNQGLDRVVFAGNFLRANTMAVRLIANAMDFCSKGTTRALFLEHEGYFGAVGCVLHSVTSVK